MDAVDVLRLKIFIKKHRICPALSGAFKKKHICYKFSMPTILFNILFNIIWKFKLNLK